MDAVLDMVIVERVIEVYLIILVAVLVVRVPIRDPLVVILGPWPLQPATVDHKSAASADAPAVGGPTVRKLIRRRGDIAYGDCCVIGHMRVTISIRVVARVA